MRGNNDSIAYDWLILRNLRPSTNIQTPSSPCKQDVRPLEWIGDGEVVQVAVEE